jgi:TRAP-type C4-dicarboxylate transport system permease small subunit
MQRLAGAVNLISKIFLIGFFSLMAVISFAQVLSRFLLNHSIFWSEEICRYGLVWITMVGASLLVNGNRMIAMTFAVQKFPQKLQRIFFISFNMFVNVFLAFVIYGGARLTFMTASQISVSTGIPMGYVYSIIPIGCFFMLVNSIALMIKEIRN